MAAMKNPKTLLALPLALLLGAALAGDDAGMPMPEWMRKTKEHDGLARYAGEWTYTARHFMQPGAPAMETTGTSAGEMVLKGNYLRYEIRGSFGGMDWVGIWHLGFDTVKKEYVGIWMDDHNPVPSMSRGVEKDGVLTLEGEGPDPQTGRLARSRMTLRWTGDDSFLLEGFRLVDKGAPVKNTEIEYRKAK